jgi:anti-sigma regulatory factor (Ser/Thr protein kinase)
MSEVGGNPARIIPFWQAFVDEHSARSPRLRGIGEPIVATRSPAELEECQLHEALLNIALADPNLWLMCAYDEASLASDVLAEARRSHPFVQHDGRTSPSDAFSDGKDLITPLNRPLPDPPPDAAVMPIDRGTLLELRNFVSARGGTAAGLSEARTADLVLAVNEIATNSLVHGGGRSRLLLWLVPGGVVCEIRDLGRIDDPLVGRIRPAPSRKDGRGIWLANQLCDLVQIRSTPRGTRVRLHVRGATSPLR